MIFDIAVQSFFIFLATVSFAIIFNVKKTEILYCGLDGVICFFIYELLISFNYTKFLSSIISVFIAVLVSRRLSFVRKIPSTVYIIPGIIPIAPGAAIYLTMYSLISGINYDVLKYSLETLTIAGGIVIGMSIALSLPNEWFNFKMSKKEK